ncbi:MAG: cell wall hydrolase [Lachnospiraceae bacterium]|nr:cell wall hydrolase [Lachnospiraceae bacterium]
MKGIKGFFCTLLTVCIMSGIFLYKYTDANATSETKRQLEEANENRKNLKNELGEINSQLGNLKDKQTGLKDKLDGLNDDLTEVSGNLAELEEKIDDKLREIDDTNRALEEARKTEEQQYSSMVQRMRYMYEQRSDAGLMNAIAGTSTIADMVNIADYYAAVSVYDKGKLAEFKETRILIETHEKQLQREWEDLEALRDETAEEKGRVSGLISSTNQNLSATANQISDAEAEALAKEAEIKKADEDIDTLQKKLAEEIAMSRRAAESVWRDISEVEFDEGDRYLLANLIYCEAGNQPYDGQVAVGAVVINRVLSSVYPDTVVGVIYQNKQFSPVASGRLALALAENKATASCYKAADEAMAGNTNVGNCVYFRTPIEGLSGIQIGGHIFY